MPYKKYSKVKHFIRDKILLPIANWLIGANKPYFLRTTIDGVMYEARYHRSRYWWDSERITLKGILKKRKTYYVTCWDGGKEGRVWCEMLGYDNHFIQVKNSRDIEELVAENLENTIYCWGKIVAPTDKEGK